MSLSIDVSLCSSSEKPKRLKYLSMGDKNEDKLTKPLLVDNINTALRVIMYNVDDHMIYENADEYRQKIRHFIINPGSNFDPTLFTNKMLLNSLWHFLNSISLDYFVDDEYDDNTYYEELFEDKILLDDWFEQYKNLIKQIGDLVEKTKIIVSHNRSNFKKTLEDNLYFTLTDIQVNTLVLKYKDFISDLKNELTDNIQFEDRNSNFEYSAALNNVEYLEKVNNLLQDVRISDFELVSSNSFNTDNENRCLIDFYEWWSNFENVKKKISSLYREIEIYNNTLEEFYG